MGLFSFFKNNNKYKDVEWKSDGWTTIQESDPAKHVLTIMCRAENGQVVEIRTRHTHGEEEQGSATVNGENVLPMPLKEFVKKLQNGTIKIN